jgi:hypothetical protein
MMGTTADMQASSYHAATEDVISERRLWTAVIVNAVEDWRNGTLRARREAQDFLFNSDKDFEMVCTAAGLNWQNFRLKLTKIGRKVEMEGTLRFPLAA